MPLNTISIAAHIAPVVLKTLWRNLYGKATKLGSNDQSEGVKDDVLFEEAYNIVKTFLRLSTNHSIESLQTYTNTHVVSPPWSAVAPVLIPLSSCDDAARKLTNWFDPDELIRVVGGARWWQVRGLNGLEAEWVTEKKFMSTIEREREECVAASMGRERGLSYDEKEILGMDHLDRIMFYVHGGGYFFGSINTHRYQILRYAKKIKGRAFTVNYRKAPQYPWPCALQDVLAAYLYLLHPPSDAVHSPVDPRKLVFAGDSAGGGLCLAVLTVIRDLGLPMPAGAVLISPWVDLTHSFPSVMENIIKDIIPEHGFIYKPSLVWPIDVLPGPGGRLAPSPTETLPPPQPGHADTLQPSPERVRTRPIRQRTRASDSQGDPLSHSVDERGKKGALSNVVSMSTHILEEEWVPNPPKILMEDSSATPLELRSQIQMYATNEQLTHPLVSPIVQGSLGNLCPLFVIAGDEEALRDEVVYLAHRAANPKAYPPRKSVLEGSKRQAENAVRFETPTKVHLQVYDGMSHVLTVYTFHESVKHAYRCIANFVYEVTSNESDITRLQMRAPPLSSSSSSSSDASINHASPQVSKDGNIEGNRSIFSGLAPKLPGLSYLFMEEPTGDITAQSSGNDVNGLTPNARCDPTSESQKTLCSDNPHMVRERIDCKGKSRPMEPEGLIAYLRVKSTDICLLKEAPARRWYTKQREWDARFDEVAKRTVHRRKKYQKKFENAERRALEDGLVAENTAPQSTRNENADDDAEIRRWGILDLQNERPPPSAIAGRRDNPDSLALLLSEIQWRTARKGYTKVAKKLQLRHSIPEQQRYVRSVTMHGVKMWTVLMSYFGHRPPHGGRKGRRRIKCSKRPTTDIDRHVV